MPIVTGYEDTPGGHDALVLGAQLTRLTGLGAIVATVYPSDGRGLAGAANDPRSLPRVRRIALGRFARAREFIGTGWGHEEPEFIALGPGPVAGVLTDFADEVAVATAVHLASRTGAALRFVAVAPTGAEEPAARVLAHKGVASAPLEIDALADVVVGPVARMLADLPERADVLVIGSRGYRFMRRLLLGGVAGALVRNARYPVVFVPGD